HPLHQATENLSFLARPPRHSIILRLPRATPLARTTTPPRSREVPRAKSLARQPSCDTTPGACSVTSTSLARHTSRDVTLETVQPLLPRPHGHPRANLLARSSSPERAPHPREPLPRDRLIY